MRQLLVKNNGIRVPTADFGIDYLAASRAEIEPNLYGNYLAAWPDFIPEMPKSHNRSSRQALRQIVGEMTTEILLPLCLQLPHHTPPAPGDTFPENPLHS